MYELPQDAVVDQLRGSMVEGVAWAPQGSPTGVGSPYYQEAPEPQPGFPYVVLKCPTSHVTHTFAKGYTEEYDFEVHVVCQEADVESLCSPYVEGSVFNFLDSLTQTPGAFSGLFKCGGWTRTSFALDFDRTYRAPPGDRVWTAVANYKMLVNFPYPGT